MKLSEIPKREGSSDRMVAEILRQQEEYLKNHETLFDSSIYQQAMKSYGSVQEEIDKLSKSGVLGTVLENKPDYFKAIAGVSHGFSNNTTAISSLQDLNSIVSSIQNDAHKFKIDELMKKDMQISAQLHHPVHIPENPIKEVIRQNKLLNEFAETRNSLLSNMYERLNEQQKSIDDQKELIRLQLDQKDKEIKDNRKWVYATLFITVISLCASGYYGWKSVNTSERIYIEENKSDDKQHQEMMQLFQKSIENNQKTDAKLLNIMTRKQGK